MTLLNKLLNDKYIPFLFRIILGLIFIYASVDKILYPQEFAQAVQDYQILPLAITNLFALILPWIELIAGLLLLNGYKTKSSVVIITGLNLIFIIAISTSLIRGLDIECGCFSPDGGRQLGFFTLIEDFLLLFMGVWVFYFDKDFFSVNGLLQNQQEQFVCSSNTSAPREVVYENG